MTSENKVNQGYRIGNIWVSPEHNVLSRAEQTEKIQPKVMAVLDYLVAHRQRVINNEELLEAVWYGRVVTHSSIQKSINALRGALGKLDDSQEYVAHFSKSGYQIVVPVDFSKPNIHEAAPLHKSVSLQWFWLLTIPLVLLLIVIKVYWQQNGKKYVNPLVSTHFSYSTAKRIIADLGSEHSAVLNPGNGILAFVREQAINNEIESQLIVSEVSGKEWIISTASGRYTDLAWSASGRNLVAMDKLGYDHPPEQTTFFDPYFQYYTFQVFTLDYKGERVLEKNRLSYWFGEVKSVSWHNENTLEFVASQAPQIETRRYHYEIPTQKLTQLKLKSLGSIPLFSKVANGRTAVLRVDNNKTLISLEDDSENYTDWPVTDVSELAWQADGTGLLILNPDRGKLSALQLNGEVVDLVLPKNLSGRINSVSSGHEEQLIVTVQKPIRERLRWRQNNNKAMEIMVQDGQIVSATAINEAKFLYAQENNSQLLIFQIDDFKTRELASIPLTQGIGSIAWIGLGEQIVFSLAAGEVKLFDLETKDLTLLTNSKIPLSVVDYDKVSNYLWAISKNGALRTLWRINIKQGNYEQLIFGGIADVLATRDGFYFQYLSQTGLWFLSKKNGELTQIASSMEKNSHLLSATDRTVLYITGGECRESDVLSLNLLTGIVSTQLKTTETNIQTLAFDVNAGFLGRSCEKGDTDIVSLSF